MPHLISRSAFARLAGVTPGAITVACRGELGAASHGDRIDTDHAAAQAYLERVSTPDPARTGSRKRRPTRPGPKPSRRPNRDRQAEAVAEAGPPSDDIESFAEMTLRELVEKFGTDRRFRDWLDALKKLEDIRGARLDNDETEKRLISFELVQTHILGLVDSAFRRLLRDAPKTAALRAHSAVRANASVEEIERLIREINSSHITHLKARATRVLRNV